MTSLSMTVSAMPLLISLSTFIDSRGISYDYLTEEEKTKFGLLVAFYYMLTPTKVHLKRKP